MLLACLKGQTVGRATVGVARDADEAAGHLALEAFAHGEVAGVRATEAHGHSETLGCADGDVGAELAGARDESECQQIGGNDR